MGIKDGRGGLGGICKEKRKLWADAACTIHTVSRNLEITRRHNNQPRRRGQGLRWGTVLRTEYAKLFQKVGCFYRTENAQYDQALDI